MNPVSAFRNISPGFFSPASHPHMTPHGLMLLANVEGQADSDGGCQITKKRAARDADGPILERCE